MTTKIIKHKYSPAEYTLLKLLPKYPKSITISELTKHYYADREMPFHGRVFVNTSMLTLMKKAKANNDVKIMRSVVKPYEYCVTK